MRSIYDKPLNPISILIVLSLLCFTYVFIITAWVVDDAYITFRVVDNFLDGYGLRWNILERVQVYTHPLWLFVITFFYWITSEFFFTCIAISFALCIASFIVFHYSLKNEDQWKTPLLILLLICSKSFVDYTSSGLENPLSYFLIALFYVIFFIHSIKNFVFTQKEILSLFIIASLAFINRQDTLLFYLPALLYLLISSVMHYRLKGLLIILIGIFPAILWLAFALLYYGFPFPNTAYAKSFNNGLSFLYQCQMGWEYLYYTLQFDFLSLLFIVLALFWIVLSKNIKGFLLFLGIGFYIAYIIMTAASATHMAGRFLSVPVFAACIILLTLIQKPRYAIGITVFALLVSLANPLSTLHPITETYKTIVKEWGWYRTRFLDVRYLASIEGAALLNLNGYHHIPPQGHIWYKKGSEVNHSNWDEIQIGGADDVGAIGYYGYALGRNKHIIDLLGLADPLLARLQPFSSFLPGHYRRYIPQGYLNSIRFQSNLFKYPCLREYYKALRIIIKDDLFSYERLSCILNFNLGVYDPLLEEYNSTQCDQYYYPLNDPENVEELPNADFEIGDISGWINVSGNAFRSDNITNENTFYNTPFLHHGEFHLFGLNTEEEERKGILKTKNFILSGNGYINLLIGGTNDIYRCFAILVCSGEDLTQFKTTGENSEIYRKVCWDASYYKGENCYIKFVDSAEWGHINIDDINLPAKTIFPY